MRRNVLLLGAPGSGKVSIARRLAAALPEPEGDTAVALAWLEHGRGFNRDPGHRSSKIPFRAPHHTVSEAGMVGSVVRRGNGEYWLYPGEVSIASGGCLLLDDLAEFRVSTIQSLGRTLAQGSAVFFRDAGRESYVVPASPALLVATVYPCACFSSWHACTCKAQARERYAERWREMTRALGSGWEFYDLGSPGVREALDQIDAFCPVEV